MVASWYADDAFWRDFYEVLFSERRFEKASEQVADLFSLVDMVPGEQGLRVLDLGCGPGRFALPLAAAGCEVCGVDTSGYLLEKARERAQAWGVEVAWEQADMRTKSHPAYFDLVVCLWSSFGYFEQRKDDLETLRRGCENLAPGGKMVVDVVGKERIVRDIQPVHVREMDNGAMLIERPRLVQEMCWMENEWSLIDGEKVRQMEWGNRLYSGQELRDQLLSAGFIEVSLYGGLDGSEYDLEAQRLVAVATKGEQKAG